MDEELEALIKEADEERDNLENGVENEIIEDEVEELPEDSEDNIDEDKEKLDDKEDEEDDVTADSGDDMDGDSMDDKSDDDTNNTEDNFKPITTTVNGHEVVINSEAEMMAFIKKGAESFNTKSDEPNIEQEIVSQANLTQEDLKLLVDAKNGDPKAIAKLAQISGQDLLDIDNNDADEYKSNFEPSIASDIDKVAQTILDDSELSQKFQHMSNTLPDSFIKNVTANAKDLATFADHVKTGLASEIIPEAIKLSYQGMDFSQAYVQVGSQIMQKRNSPVETKQREVTDRAKNLRKQASDNGGNNNKGKNLKGELTEDEVWNLSDEDFEALTASKS